jgi:hypothetical protein
MAKKKVLIVGQTPDPHIENVAERLLMQDASVVVLDRQDLEICISLTFDNGEKGAYFSEKKGSPVDLSVMDSVWWRIKPAFQSEYVGGMATVAEKFRMNEWKPLLQSLTSILPNARWVNDVAAQYSSGQKPGQLALAQKVGLKIPKTIVTNSADEALRFFKSDERIIYKTLNAFIAPPDEMVFTNEISRSQIAQSAPEISLAPCIFQKYVEKKYEVRATVVGEEVFSVKIDSQRFPETAIDWRKNQFLPIYEICHLSPATTRLLLDYHRLNRLVFAAYDFIVDEDHNEIFLECNPGGQWLWLEDRLQLPITDSLVKALLAN